MGISGSRPPAGTTFRSSRQHPNCVTKSVSGMTENPFFEAWDTPFELPPFDRIRPEHFPPAFDRGMAEHIADIAAITGSPEMADFANTLEASTPSGRLLPPLAPALHH